MHRVAVLAIIQNKEGKFLMMRRSVTKEWHFVRGGIEEGESKREALTRELSEEAGITEFDVLGESKEPFTFDYPKDHPSRFTSQTNHLFAVRAEEPITYPDGEMDQHKWLTYAETITNTIWPDTVKMFKRVCEEFSLN